LAEKLESTKKDVNQVWNKCLAGLSTVFCGKATAVDVRVGLGCATPPSSNGEFSNSPENLSPHVQPSGTEAMNPNKAFPTNTGTPEVIIERLLRELSNRGKGSNYCSHRLACKKGGASPAGALFLFKSNSAFRYVFNI